MFPWHISQVTPPIVTNLQTPLLAQRFLIPPLPWLYSLWDHLLTFSYCVELNQCSNRSHECHRQLEGEKVKKEQDLSLLAMANLHESAESTHFAFTFTGDPGSSFLEFIPCHYASGSDPNGRGVYFPGLAQKRAYTMCLYDLR